MKKYLTRGSLYGTEISAVDVLRETAAMVYIERYGRELRYKKVTDYEVYHDTYSAARAYLISKAEQRVSSAEYGIKSAHRALDDAKEKLTKAQAIPEKEPT